jgi:hypothetical protein
MEFHRTPESFLNSLMNSEERRYATAGACLASTPGHEGLRRRPGRFRGATHAAEFIEIRSTPFQRALPAEAGQVRIKQECASYLMSNSGRFFASQESPRQICL